MIIKIPTYSYTTTNYTTVIKSSIKHSKPLDLPILLFSYGSIKHCKTPLFYIAYYNPQYVIKIASKREEETLQENMAHSSIFLEI
jgi:hypothetical protein